MKLRVPAPRAVRVPGYRFAGVACGIKENGRRDVSLIVSDRPAVAVGVFTTNRVCAAPVEVARERLRGGLVQAVVTNSGNANALTGTAGLRAARAVTRETARCLGIPERLVVPCSTGRIGVPLPLPRVLQGVREASRQLSTGGFARALEGIMTTDAFPKWAAERITVGGSTLTLAAMAKGAGMIAPRMATLLVYLLTDAAIGRRELGAVLRAGLPRSFNAIVVDGDTSTNDTVLFLANGMGGNRPLRRGSRDWQRFADAAAQMMHDLARQVVRDGEGSSRIFEITVRGARSRRDAERAADAVARSPLCKTALHGADPYAGRIACALGYSGARFDPERLNVWLGGLQVVRNGVEQTFRFEDRAAAAVSRPVVELIVDFQCGEGEAYRMASDLGPAYVRFNSAYRT